ncbi:hypothetical protein PPTG_03534 [Phytophthora nicotianae INRA-310]|uniref:BED-type domain-containing protein n=1 Tax=Phytophthora nicotianae (strain INRA-310) TaxID=761204 RepID=W2R588_PHYN3|nr:hypothetical protein PPTG_03534 [Phytophthora nicotianae INRA-310]ETN20548.1 hypothetical protein PPTG_03534 [Phytophthora nicotianae INRA-310]
MKRFHPEYLRAYTQRQEKQQSQTAARRLVNIYESANVDEGIDEPATDVDQKRFVDLLVQWIASDLRPLSTANDAGLIATIEFANSVRGRLRIPARQTTTSRLQIRAAEFRSSLRIRLSDKGECLYFSVSLRHAQMDMHKWTLEVISIPGKHNAPAIAAALLPCFDNWNLDRTLCVRFLRDGAPNMKRACDQIGVTSMSCIAHSLHLVVGAALIRKPSDLPLTTSVDDINDTIGINPRDVNNSDASGSSDSDTSTLRAMASTASLGRGMTSEDNRDDDDSGLDEPIDPDEVIAICEQVAEFVQDCEMAPGDLERIRQIVRRFRKLAEYFHRIRQGQVCVYWPIIYRKVT